ncbi:hypothetical protein [Agrobacterium tumefaciens]|uniref:hypothetical protein n=1 Tax=Agrobacterium tumefaciens TaxID=358 RepID=UPI0023411140|nr:hypothetical protein [Agrobacterium tumefaciens]WCK69418.1 hypothetical protein G6L23_027495 [Agrobacterium tumefaciens]
MKEHKINQRDINFGFSALEAAEAIMPFIDFKSKTEVYLLQRVNISMVILGRNNILVLYGKISDISHWKA